MHTALVGFLLLFIPNLRTFFSPASAPKSRILPSSLFLFMDPLFWADVARFSVSFWLVNSTLRNGDNLPPFLTILRPIFGDLEQNDLTKAVLIYPVVFFFFHLFPSLWNNKDVLHAPVSYCFALAMTIADPVTGFVAVLAASLISLAQMDLRWLLPALAVTFSLGAYLDGASRLAAAIASLIFFLPQVCAAFLYRRIVFL